MIEVRPSIPAAVDRKEPIFLYWGIYLYTTKQEDKSEKNTVAPVIIWLET